MKRFLINKFGFPNDSICILTDDSKEKNTIPTKSNLRRAMRVKDLNKDEIDGCDKAICPVNYESEGKILDDEMNATIVRPLPHGVKLHALVDATFSGIILDLPFVCRMNRNGSFGWKDHRHRRGGYKSTKGGLAVSISACDDNGSATSKSFHPSHARCT